MSAKDELLKDYAELGRLLKKCRDPHERREIRRTMEEIRNPQPVRIVPMPASRGETGLSFWKRRFSARLAEAMRKKDWTATELALATGLPYPYVKRVIAAKTYPAHKGRRLMARALGTTLKFLES